MKLYSGVLNFSKKIIVNVSSNNNFQKYLWIFSPQGRIRKKILGNISLKVTCNLLFLRSNSKSLLNMYLSVLKNLFLGVLKQYSRFLEMRGTGFKFEIKKLTLILKIGFSHTVVVPIPFGISLVLLKSNLLYLKASDLHYLTEFCSRLQFYKKLDSYKGKGICFRNYVKVLKEGKKVQQ